MISIKAENLEYAKMLLGDAPKQIHWAAVRAINSAVTEITTQISTTIRKNYAIKAKSVKGNLHIERASRSKLHGVVASKGRPVLLSAFDLRSYKKRKGPMRAKIRNSENFKPVKGLFLGTSRTGYVGAMQRTQLHARYPLRIPYGPSVPQMFGSPDVVGELAVLAQATLNKRFLHEVEQRFSKKMK